MTMWKNQVITWRIPTDMIPTTNVGIIDNECLTKIRGGHRRR
jgi:hypothetical protein